MHNGSLGASFDLSGHRPIVFDFDVDGAESASPAFDVLLVRDGVVRASLGRDRKYRAGKRLPQSLREQTEALVADCAAIADRRLFLCFDALRRESGLRLAVVVSSQMPSAARVLCHSFSDRLALTSSVTEAGEGGLRQSDAGMYVFFGRLLSLLRHLLHGTEAEHRITSWSELTVLLSRRMRTVCALLLPSAATCFDGIGDLPMPIRGSISTAQMTALLLCAVMGAACVAPNGEVDVCGETDYRMFLPQLRVSLPPKGDRATELPAAWQEAKALARRCEMFFGVQTAEDGFRLCLCPLRPEQAGLYALRAAALLAESEPAEALRGESGQPFSMQLPYAVLRVLWTLERAGYPAYIVGGSLRDALRGKTPHDWDVTTPATPSQMQSVFEKAGLRTVETGIKHGTITVLVDHEPIECTTYRIDGAYTDGRHPDDVRFTDRIADDLCRRDFTVNAMACRLPTIAAMDESLLSSGLCTQNVPTELVDLFGGREDLRRGVLRCVGEPVRRLTEDALRILRCVRFCVQLDCRVEQETARALASCREGLACVSAERRATELTRMLTCENDPREGLRLLDAAQLWRYVLPECAPSEAQFARVALLPPDAAMRVAQLYYNNGKTVAETEVAVWKCCSFLRLSRDMTEDATALARGAYEPRQHGDAALRRLMAHYGARAERVLLLCALRDAEMPPTADGALPALEGCLSPRWKDTLAAADQTRARGDCLSIASLAISGADLSQRGIKGAQIGQTLRWLLERVLEDPSLNQKETLLALLKETKGEE
jgi:tRNA nucleotidyltransferase (CCA-adding enzyme)